MRRNRQVRLACVLIAGIVTAWVTPTADARRVSCRAPHSVVEASDGGVLILKRHYTDFGDYDVYYVCRRRSDRAQRLFEVDEADNAHVYNWRLSGRYSAVVDHSVMSDDAAIDVFDLRTRRQVARHSFVTQVADVQLALTRTGTTVWTNGPQVVARRLGADAVVLGGAADGQPIARDSLALSTSQAWAYWRDAGGSTYSAAVP